MSELRRIRINKEMSIPQLALASNVSAEQIRNLETGRARNPRPATLAKLAKALKVKPAELDPFLTDRRAA